MNSNSIPPMASNDSPANPLQYAQGMPGMLSQIPWPAMMAQNPLLTQALATWPQQQQQASIMQQAQTMAGVNGMGFIPTQILQDALRMSAPVGSSPDDDVILAKTLHDSVQNGITYKRAIESLHGVNNHASSLWKDYYLDNMHRIDQLVANHSLPYSKAAKKPLIPSSPPPDSPPRGKPPGKRRRTSANKTSEKPVKSNIQRKTINSITTFAPVFDASMPAPHADVQIPPPPSRSPTPPPATPLGGNRNRYSDADRAFFLKFIAWRLKEDPSLNKAELCEKLAEKAPHHSQGSWLSHWHVRHDVADKILAAARQENSEDSDSDQSSDGGSEKRKGRRYHKAEDNSVDGSYASGSDEGDDEDEDEPKDMNSDEDEAQMGKSGSLTEADLRFLAKHVAANPDWHIISNKNRFASFYERFPQRSELSWAYHYRRHEKKIIRWARIYTKRNLKAGSPVLQTQRGRPSWASKSDGSTQKRKSLRDDDEDYHRSKRAKSDSDFGSGSNEEDDDDYAM